MSRKVLLVFFLFLFVCCQLCGQACGAQSDESLSNVVDGNTISDFFKLTEKQIEYEFDSEGTQEGKKITTNVKNIGPVFLVANSDFLVALAEVKNGDANNEKIDLLAKFLKTGGKTLGKEAFKGDGWKKQLVSENLTDLKGNFKVKSSAVVVNGNKIYHFLVTDTTVAGSSFEDTPANFKWQITVIVGEIDSSGEPQKNEAMKWRTLGSDKLTNTEELNNKLKINSNKIPPVVSFGFAIGDTIVFAIQGEGKGNYQNKNVIVFFKLEKDGQKLEFLHEEPTGKCHPSLFLWEEHIVMVPTACEKDGDQEIKTFNYKGNKLTENTKAINFLPEFLKDKKDFVTTKIDTTADVLLFTQRTKEPKIYLWMTDGKRTAKVEAIITGAKYNVDLSILHINNELFVLQKQKRISGDAVDKYDLKRLPDHLNKIKSILKAWENTDNEVKKLFEETAPTDTFFTDGLVGFLAGNNQNSGTEWVDEYFYEKAKVTSGTKYGQGFKFNGAESRAVWPVGKTKTDQLYNFISPGFTLLASVTVEDGTSSNYNSILGVSSKNPDNNVGLWCSKEGMWGVGDLKSTAEGTVTKKECAKKRTYQVTLVYQGNKISVYIDWELLGGEQNFEISDGKQEELQFYFGAHTAQRNVESHVAVANVLLYNRPFEQGKINELREKVKSVEDIKKSESVDTNTTGNNDEHPIENKKEDKMPSPSRTEDGGVGCGVRVLSLLLAVLCVSAPLLHL